MEFSIDNLLGILGLFIGGGGGAFFTWRWQRKKARAEAESAEVDAAKDLQDMYQQMLADAKADREDRKAQIEELRHERDHYKQDRNELRERLDETDAKIRDLQREVARNGRQIEMMRPFICTDLSCKLRQRGTISDLEAIKNVNTGKRSKKAEVAPVGTCTGDIEPLNMKDL